MLLSYYDPYPRFGLEQPVVLMAPPWSGLLASAAWIANTTGIRFIDLDALVEHRMATAVVALATTAMEGAFRNAQLQVLGEELVKKPYGIFASEDVGFWPSLRGISKSPFYALDVQPHPESHFESFQLARRNRRREKFASRPWLLEAPREFEAFSTWVQNQHSGDLIAHETLTVASAEPIGMSNLLKTHLMDAGLMKEYGV